MAKTKIKTKSEKKKKYESFSKINETEKLKPSDATKEEKESAERSYSGAMRIFRWPKAGKGSVRKKRFCKTCQTRTFFNRTKEDSAICTRCGMREGELKTDRKV